MKIKSLLIATVLAIAVLCSGSFVKAQVVDNSALIAQIKVQIVNLTAQLQQLIAQQQSASVSQQVAVPSAESVATPLTNTNGYIVELTEPSISITYEGLNSNISSKLISDSNKAKLLTQKEKILNQQDSFLSSLSSTIKSKNTAVTSSNKSKAFSIVLNAVVLDIDEKEAAELSKLPDVKSVELVKTVYPTLMDSVPLIRAPQVWAGSWTGGIPTTGRGVTIAIIDTGVDYLHPDLGGCFGSKIVNGQTVWCKVAGGYDFVNNDFDPMDDAVHGTQVASVAAGNNTLKGVAPDATIYAYKVMGTGGGSGAFVVAALEATVDPNKDGDISDHLDVANLSLGAPGGIPDDFMSRAVDNAVVAGVVIAVSAGNSGYGIANTIWSPGSARNAITVGAVDNQGKLADFSSLGPVSWTNASGVSVTLIKPDVVAPGVSICGARMGFHSNLGGITNCSSGDTNHIRMSGTSQASPHVAGEAALMLQLHPDWNPLEIKAAIRNNTGTLSPTNITNYGYGRIDALGMVQSARPPVAQLSPLGIKKGLMTGIISGTATSFQNYSGYTLSYGLGTNPTSFSSPFYISGPLSPPVSNGVLSSNFDTTELGQGIYTIKLTVTDTLGNTSIDEGQITVDHMEVTSVGNNLNYINGGIEKIYGSIFYPTISSFKVLLNDPINGSVLCSGNSVPTGEAICYADFSGLSNGVYNLYLEVLKKGVWEIDAPVKFAVVNELLENWPQQISGPSRGVQVVTGTDANQLKKQLVVSHYTYCGPDSCYGTSLYFYSSDGSYTKLPFLNDGSNIPYDDMPSVVYNNLSKNQEIVTVNSNQGNSFSKVIKSDGTVIASWQNNESSDAVERQATIFDRDNNGEPEIYNINFDTWSQTQPNSQGAKIMGHNFSGNSIANFPVSIPLDPYPRQFVVSNNISFLKGQNGQNMMVVAGSYTGASMIDLKLYAHIFSPENTLIKSTLLFDNTGKTEYLSGGLTYPVSADLNGDGKTEVVIAYSTFDTIEYNTYIKVLDSEGNIISSAAPIKGYRTGGVGKIGSLAIGDLGNSRPNIVVILDRTSATTAQGDKIMVFDSLLNPVFTISEQSLNLTQDVIKGVSIGDVNGDGKSELIFNYNPVWTALSPELPSGILIFSNQGVLIKDIQIPNMGGIGDTTDFKGSPVILDDFNNDGKVDAVLQATSYVKSPIAYQTTRLYALDLGGTYNVSNISWKTFLHDDQHTGIFVSPPPLNPQLSIIKIATGWQISFSSVPGATYSIQASTNLISWTQVATVTVNSTGQGIYVDTQASLSSRFYKATLIPTLANTPPFAQSQSVTLPANTSARITLAATDAEHDPLTYSITPQFPPLPEHGSLVHDPAFPGDTSKWIYTPTPNYSGSDTFNFKANDGKLDSNTATVFLTITATTGGGGGPTPINGICGLINGLEASSAPTTDLCSVGTASTVTGFGPWTWICAGNNGGTSASCFSKIAGGGGRWIINGACGPANGVATYSAPNMNLCSAGNPSAVTYSEGVGYIWTCTYDSDGLIPSCSAPLLPAVEQQDIISTIVSTMDSLQTTATSWLADINNPPLPKSGSNFLSYNFNPGSSIHTTLSGLGIQEWDFISGGSNTGQNWCASIATMPEGGQYNSYCVDSTGYQGELIDANSCFGENGSFACQPPIAKSNTYQSALASISSAIQGIMQQIQAMLKK